MDPLDAIMSRRSVGRVGQEPVPRALLEEIITAAIHAPNHHLTEPWRFVVLTGAARGAVGAPHAAKLERAPVVIACIVRPTGDDPVTMREDRDAVAAGIENLLLAAHGRGLGAMWRTGGMVDDPQVRAHLGLGPTEAIVGFVYVGFPETEPLTKPRPPIDDIVEWRGP